MLSLHLYPVNDIFHLHDTTTHDKYFIVNKIVVYLKYNYAAIFSIARTINYKPINNFRALRMFY